MGRANEHVDYLCTAFVTMRMLNLNMDYFIFAKMFTIYIIYFAESWTHICLRLSLKVTGQHPTPCLYSVGRRLLPTAPRSTMTSAFTSSVHTTPVIELPSHLSLSTAFASDTAATTWFDTFVAFRRAGAMRLLTRRPPRYQEAAAVHWRLE